MKLTPVRIRGKRKTRAAEGLNTQQFPSATGPKRPHSVSPSNDKTNRPVENPTKTRKKKKARKLPTTTMPPSLLALPQELLEQILLLSLNPSLPRSSPRLSTQLSSPHILLEFTMSTFFHTIPQPLIPRLRNAPRTSDPVLQSTILASRFFTFDFFLQYVARVHKTLTTMRGRAWKDAGVALLPDERAFGGGLWPHKFAGVVPSLGFAEGFSVPEKVLRGPFGAAVGEDEGKAKLLYVLVAMGGEIDWVESLAGETAKAGIREAVRARDERAVAALAVLLGTKREIDTRLLSWAVEECGCDFAILRHLLYNAQILHSAYADVDKSGNNGKHLDFLDPSLWAWADAHPAQGGPLLKTLLRQASRFNMKFYFEDSVDVDVKNPPDWTQIVPFPYSGPKFDARTGFGDMERELLMNLYRNFGRRITRGRRRGTREN